MNQKSRSDPTELLRRADQAVRANRLGEATAAWKQALSVRPDHPVALNGLGMIAMAEGRTAEAADYLLRSALADPAQSVLWLNHAGAARAIDDVAGERSSLDRARAIDPLSLEVHVRLAQLAERVGDEAAGQHWAAAVELAARAGTLPPMVRAAIEHGRGFLARQSDLLGRKVDAALASRRSAMPATERRRIDAAFDHALGRRTIYLNQCSGLHVPFLPADEFFDRALFDWLPLLEAETSAIRAELLNALDRDRDGFEPYVALPPGTPRNVWSALDGSMDWSTLHLWRHGVRDEAVCARFPQTAEIVDRLPLARIAGRMPTVFFSALAARSHIPPHTGVTNARAIVHLPLIVPDGCRFRVGAETRTWIEGEAFAFDDTIEHEAWNDSDVSRAVLILDVWNPHLTAAEQTMIDAFYGADQSTPASERAGV